MPSTSGRKDNGGPPQFVGDKFVDRFLHVWKRQKDERYKCILCGGVTTDPSRNDLPSHFEKLASEERTLCPPQN